MLQLANIWLLIAGLGMFLFGMHQLEYALKELGGAQFRKMLRSFTKTTWKGILVGVGMTAILQSSSLVTLMVLAFLGAGMLRLKNALGVILGANLGTVVTAWLVVLLGFSVPIKDFAMPFIGLGSMAFLFAANRPNLKYLGMFLFGFGLLFLGLDFMKESIEEVATQFDLQRVAHLGLWVFLLTGILVTAIIQSSSAMIVIILSSLNAQVIDLVQASVLVIGANIGTTITVGIGAINGVSDKRRLALAHFIFNVITGLLFFFIIENVVEGIFNRWSVQDTLIKLVIISTLIKATGVLIFYPFIAYLEKWLLKRFKRADAIGSSRYIKNVSFEVPEIAIQAAEKETEGIVQLSLSYIEAVLGIDKRMDSTLPYLSLLKTAPNTESRYENLKQLEDELTTYSLKIQEQNLTEIEAYHLDQIMQAIRSQTFAAKEVRDIQHNIKQIQQSNDALAKDILQELTTEMNILIQDIRDGLSSKDLEAMAFYARKEKYIQAYNSYIAKLHLGLKNNAFKDLSLSSVSNVIRKMLAAMQYIAESADVLVLAKQDVFPEITSEDTFEEKMH